eukprot:7982640-Pyramimonas_sp.AAC.1
MQERCHIRQTAVEWGAPSLEEKLMDQLGIRERTVYASSGGGSSIQRSRWRGSRIELFLIAPPRVLRSEVLQLCWAPLGL